MDDREPPSQTRRGLLSGQYHQSSRESADQRADTPASGASGATGAQPSDAPQSGGLLSRFAQVKKAPEGPSSSAARGWNQLAGSARRIGENLRRRASGHEEPQPERKPSAGNWRATDFSTGDLDRWDHQGDIPFEVPPDPDAPNEPMGDDRYHDARGQEHDRAFDRDNWQDERRAPEPRRRAYADNWDDVAWEDERQSSWDTGSWDTAWATYDEPAEEPAPRPRRRARSQRTPASEDRNLIGGLRQALDEDVLSDSLNTLAQLGAVTRPLSRVARVRLLMQRRPAAAAMLAFFLLGFMLTCCAPLIPLARLGYDTVDLARHVAHLQQMAAGGTAQLINSSKLAEAQVDIAAIEGDLYEINGAVTVVGAPLGAVSHSVRNYQLLVRMGYDLTGAANESIQVAQSLLTPLEGGALSASSSSPSITPANIQQARALLADAYARTLDAVDAYQQIDQGALPAQLKPGTRYGKLLALLPLAQKVFGELKNLLDAVPALLGVGQPAYYLAVAMDSSELRPGGGFQGNYGLLEIDGGKQSKSAPFSLTDTYPLDATYAQKQGITLPNCNFTVTEPPNSAWWWPVRCVEQYGWGLRDSNLSPDFPTNARTAIQIVQSAGMTPNGAPIQGVVAFTPGLIADILQATGPLPMPEYNTTVTASNLEAEIHTFQLTKQTAAGQDRKQFTHDLSSKLLARLKSLHGSGLKTIFSIAEHAIQSKDLQVYLADPRAELILQQLGLDSSITTGNGDGYFVVDTNDGGNKANLYVTESQTDLVTLLPNGGAYHRLAISVTYNRQGNIYNPGSTFYDYSDVQRTYLPGDAIITGWSGFVPPVFYPSDCQGTNIAYAAIVTDCSQAHGIFGVTTNSDVPGRTMVMGQLMVFCGDITQGDWGAYAAAQEYSQCVVHSTSHTQTVFLSWYTPHAYSIDASGHGAYTELVEKQAGDQPSLAVYVTRASAISGPAVITDLATFNSLTANAKSVFNGPLVNNQIISYSF